MELTRVSRQQREYYEPMAVFPGRTRISAPCVGRCRGSLATTAENVISFHVCRRIMRWQNGRTRRSQNPTRKKSLKTAIVMGKRAKRIPSWPGVINPDKGRIHLCLPYSDASHFACGEAAGQRFRVGDNSGLIQTWQWATILIACACQIE